LKTVFGIFPPFVEPEPEPEPTCDIVLPSSQVAALC
jgi:hypothetical protein